MRKPLLTAILWTAALAGAAADVPANHYPCLRAPQEPRIDGVIAGDPAWQAVPGVTGFRALGGDFAHVRQTTAWMCWTPDAVCIAMLCEEPDAAGLKPSAKDGGWTWGEDSVEIFLTPLSGGQTYQFGVTAGGAKGSGEGGPDITACTAAATIASDAYTLELRIPYAVLGVKPPAAGTCWHGTFCRNVHMVTKTGGDKFTTWSPLQARFLEPENFATIEFADRVLSVGEAKALTEDMNRPYRQQLSAQVAALAARAGEFRPALEGARAHPRLGRQAQELLAMWQRLEELAAQSTKASLPEVRRALLDGHRLLDASYQTKYAGLLEQLFETP